MGRLAGLWKWLRESAGDAIVAAPVALGIDMALKKYGDRIVTQQIFTADERGALMQDILDLPDENKKNLLRWHLEADAGRAPLPWFTENAFVTMLCKIEPDVMSTSTGDSNLLAGARHNSRRDVLTKLNALRDEEFWQMMNFLRHDPVRSNFEYLLGEAKEILEKAEQNVGGAVTPLLKGFNDWLEGKKPDSKGG